MGRGRDPRRRPSTACGSPGWRSRRRRAYDEAKRARGGLDFDDLLLKTRDLLASHARGRPRRAWRGRSTCCSSTSSRTPTRSRARSSAARAATASATGRLFLVGDFKQSIYRFRGAEPRIFQDFRGEFPAEGRLALTENFRSVPAILDFVNALFADDLPRARATALDPGPRTPAPRRPARRRVPLGAPSPRPTTAKPEARRRRPPEGRGPLARPPAPAAARRGLDGPRPEDRASADRPTPGDVAFLFRAMTDVGPYESALADEGFDYHVVGGSAFYAQQEVHDLINVLSAIEDPLDAVSLAGALRSPFFCLSDDGLFWLGDVAARRPGRRARRGPSRSPSSRRSTAAAPAGRATCCARWRGLKDRVPIAALVDRVLDESGYEAALLGEFLGDRKRANARKLVRLARRFDEQGGFTLADFVARLRADLREPPREEQAATTDEEGTSVRLMSIHQAKGLEFPIVVLPDLNRKPARRLASSSPSTPTSARSSGPSDDRRRPTAADGRRGGLGRSLGWLTYQAIEQREEEDEALRLFYVATTRARDALILSAGVGPDEKPTSPALKLLDERFDRATGPLPRPAARRLARARGRGDRRSARPGRAPAPRRGGRRPALARGRPGRSTTAPSRPSRRRRPRPAPAPVRRPRPGARASPRRRPGSIGWSARSWPIPGVVRAEAARARSPARPARRQDPVAPAEPGRRGRRPARALARRRRSAASWPAPTTVERGVAWTLAWPPGRAEPTVFQGRIDFLYRDRRAAGRPGHRQRSPARRSRASGSGSCSRPAAADALGLRPDRARAGASGSGPAAASHGEDDSTTPRSIDGAIGASLR